MKGLKVAQQISLDVVVNNDGETGSFNHLMGKQKLSRKYYAVATMKWASEDPVRNNFG